MISQNHSIERINFRVNFSSEKQAKSLQDKYFQLLKRKALPALETLLDKYDQPGFLLRIDKLQLHLGDFSVSSSEKALVDRLLAQVENQLILMVQASTLPLNEKVQKIPLQLSKLEALSTFLATGTLPFIDKTVDFQKELEALWAVSPTQFYETIKTVYRAKGRAVLLRLFYQLDAPMWKKLIEFGLDLKTATELLILKKTLEKSSISTKLAFNKSFWISAFEVSLNPLHKDKKVVQRFWGLFTKQSNYLPKEEAAIKKLIPKRWLPILKEEMIGEPIELPADVSSTEEPDFLYCSNAGIVLLQPFLKSFFAACNLLDNSRKKFAREANQYKAVYLLHYLATGEWITPEYNLVLQKIICGLPPDKPIPRAFTLSKTEKEESLQVLRAVLKHWPKLGNTSPDGLREGFLQREGKLQLKNKAWVLKVEKKTLDILMESLPWSFSRIKLPWMKSYIRVEWTS